MWVAYFLQVGDLCCIKLLIAFGAHVNEVGKYNQTPLDLATSQWAMLQRSKAVSVSSPHQDLCIDSSAKVVLPGAHNGAGMLNTGDGYPTFKSPVTSTTCGSVLNMLQQAQFSRPRTLTSSIHNTGLVAVSRTFCSSHTQATSKPHQNICHSSVSGTSSEDPRDFLESMLIRDISPDSEYPKPDTLDSPISPSCPLDPCNAVVQLLYSVGAQRQGSKWFREIQKLPKLISQAESSEPEDILESIKICDFTEGRMPFSLCEQLTEHINSIMESGESLSGNIDEAIAISFQEKEIKMYRKTRKVDQIAFMMTGGSRILVLDGGGMKGLIELDLLAQLEKYTGKTVIELFDWIIGTSTGGIVALALVYGRYTLYDWSAL